MTDENDFSFPIIATKPISNFTIPSTSLWRISSLVYSDCYSQGEDHDQKGNGSEGSSSSPSEFFSSRKSSSDEVDTEERMDMLWEYLNEESKMVDAQERGLRTSRSSSEYFNDYMYHLDGVGASGEMQMVMVMEEYKKPTCEKALKISNRTKVLKKPSMVVVLRTLKKFFFLQNLARTRN